MPSSFIFYRLWVFGIISINSFSVNPVLLGSLPILIWQYILWILFISLAFLSIFCKSLYESIVCITLKSLSAFFILLLCRCPIRWSSPFLGKASFFFSASCIVFSPKYKTTKLTAFKILFGGWFFDTANSFVFWPGWDIFFISSYTSISLFFRVFAIFCCWFFFFWFFFSYNFCNWRYCRPLV